MEYWYGFIGDEYDFPAKGRIMSEWALSGWKFTGHAVPDDGGMQYLMTRELRVE